MDTAAIDAAGTKPLEPELARIAGIKSVADLQGEAERLHTRGVGAFFRFNSGQDLKDSTQVIGSAFQGGLVCRSASIT
jgi:putative endopeptidase